MELDNTLRASGLGTFEVLTYDHDLSLFPLGDLQFIAKCAETRPDAVILSSWWHELRHPGIESLRFVRERLGIPLVAIWWDTCSDRFFSNLEPLLEYFDVHVVAENPNLYFSI